MIEPPNLDFVLHDTLQATHGLHAFAAKCPPPLVAWGIKKYSEVGQCVVDPMVGSGTTLVEGRLAGRHVHGADIDPLASMLSRVKATPLPADELQIACQDLLAATRADFATWDRLYHQGLTSDECDRALRIEIPDFHNRDRWFLPEVSAKLAIIKRAITTSDYAEPFRNFFYIAFSSLIVARTSVANARDIVHSRHHFMEHTRTPDIPVLFARRLVYMQRRMAEFRDRLPSDHQNHRTIVYRADARKLPIPDDIADLIFTSPPYCNALDYPRAHQLAIAWLGDVLGLDSTQYTTLARTYIGSDRASKALPLDLDCIQVDSPTAQRVIAEVAQIDIVRAAVVQRYFQDMTAALIEMGRILKPERHAVLVICPSNIRRVTIPSHEVFLEIGDRLDLPGGYRLGGVAHHERIIDDRKRLLPYMDGTDLAKRMRTEYVIVLQKQRQRVSHQNGK